MLLKAKKNMINKRTDKLSFRESNMLDFIKIFIMVSITAICFASQTFASTLDNMEIKPNGNSFDVVLNSKDKIDAKTTVSNDKMVMVLKDTKPADNFYTKYNTHIIDNLIIKTDKNNTKIIIKSKNLPSPTPNNNYYLLLGLCGLAFMFRRKPLEEKITFRAKTIKTSNIDYLLEHKIKKEEKFKIAA